MFAKNPYRTLTSWYLQSKSKLDLLKIIETAFALDAELTAFTICQGVVKFPHKVFNFDISVDDLTPFVNLEKIKKEFKSANDNRIKSSYYELLYNTFNK